MPTVLAEWQLQQRVWDDEGTTLQRPRWGWPCSKHSRPPMETGPETGDGIVALHTWGFHYASVRWFYILTSISISEYPKVSVRRLSMAKNMPTFCASSSIQKGSSFCPRLVLSLIFPSNRSYFPTSLSFPSRFSRCSLPKGVVLVVLYTLYHPIYLYHPIPAISALPDRLEDAHIQSHQHIFCYCLDGTRGAGPQASCWLQAFSIGSSLFFQIKTWSFGVPSGKRLHNYRKSPVSMGKSTINGHFQ